MNEPGYAGPDRPVRGHSSGRLGCYSIALNNTASDNDPWFEAFYKNELANQKNVFDEKKNLLESMNRLLHQTLKQKEGDLEEAKRELKELRQVFKLRAPKCIANSSIQPVSF